MDHMSVKFNNGHSGVLVCIQLHECKTAISIHAYLRKVSNGLEERDQVRLSAIGDEVANVDCSVVLVRLPHDCLVREGGPPEKFVGTGVPLPLIGEPASGLSILQLHVMGLPWTICP